MNARIPCLTSIDEARHAQAEGKREDASEYWLARAAQAVRDTLPPRRPEDWFACVVPGPDCKWSADEILADALDADNTPVREQFARLMTGQGDAAALHQTMVDYWIESRGEAIAAKMERDHAREVATP